MVAEIEVDEAGGVVSGRGEIDLAAADDLRRAIDLAIGAHPDRPVVIDLRAVTFIDSTGIRELIRPAVEGHEVTLRRPSEIVLRVLRITGLETTVTIEPA